MVISLGHIRSTLTKNRSLLTCVILLWLLC